MTMRPISRNTEADLLAAMAEVLSYDPSTGHFTWLPQSGKRRAGTRAGAVIGSGYRQIKFRKQTYLEHRLAWFFAYGCWPSGGVDHINRHRVDNRICNLREATQLQNNFNTPSRGGASKFKGVYREKGQWRARIKFDNRNKCLGYFNSEEAAAVAYDAAATRLAGRFAFTNFPLAIPDPDGGR